MFTLGFSNWIEISYVADKGQRNQSKGDFHVEKIVFLENVIFSEIGEV
jgi:hypothetical protein